MTATDPAVATAPPTTPPTVLFLPGLLCDAEVWREVRDGLGAAVTSVVAEYGLAHRLAAMADIALAQVPGGPLVLVGHSMGGRVALEIARRAPQRVQAMCLLNTGYQPLAAGAAGATERTGRMALLELARAGGMLAMARQWATPMVHPRHHGTALFQRILDMIARRSPAVFQAQIQALLERPDASPVLRAAACPVVLATGSHDAWSPVPQHQAMAALAAQATLTELADCGHMSPMEQPHAIVALVQQALAMAGTQAAPAAAPATPWQRVAFIGFGEAGTCLGAALAARGVSVSAYDVLVHDAQGADALVQRARAAGVTLHDSLQSAIEGAELVVSAVTAAAATTAAQQAAACLRPDQWFLDINSVSPGTKRADEAAIVASGAHYVEAAVMAPVPPSGLRVPMLLGGAHATAMATRLVATGFRARAVAARVGVASAVKMCRSVVIKGLESITTEGLLAARRHGAEDAVLASLAETFPDMGWTEQLPDYLISRVAEHGRRRAEEMREAVQTLHEVGHAATMSEASARQQDALVDAMQAAGIRYDASRAFVWRELADALHAAAGGTNRN